MDAREAAELIARLEGRRVLYVLHQNADPDCVGSAIALAEAWPGDVAAPEGVSRAGAKLAQRAGLTIDPWPHPEQFETVVAVDTSSASQLGRLAPRVGAPLLVDHHAYGDLQAGAPAKAWDPTRGSCAEVVLALLDLAQKPVSARAAHALLAGLVADTAQFRHAGARALRDAARLVEASGVRIEDILDLLARDEEEGEDDDGMRRATLLAAQRAEVSTVGRYLVATSGIGAFDAAAATALVRAGADVAIVAAEKQQTARMSLRASARAREAGVHLGHIAHAAAQQSGWSGGGHEGAAGLQGAQPIGPAREAVLKLVRSALEAR